MIFFEVFRALWRMLERRRRAFLVALMGLLFSSGVFEMLGMMIVFGFIRGMKVGEAGHRSGPIARAVEIGLGHPSSDYEYAVWAGGLLLAAIVAKNAQSLLVRYHVTRFLSNLNHRIGMQLFAALAALPYEEAIRGGQASLPKKLRSTLELLNVCFTAVTQIVASGATLTTLMGLLMFVDIRLTALFILLFGTVGLAQNRLLSRRLKRLGTADRDALAAADQHLTNMFEGLVEARLRDRIPYFQSRFGQALGVRMRVRRQLLAWGRIPSAANETLLAVSIAVAVLSLALRHISLADAMATFAAFGFVGMRSVTLLSTMSRSHQWLTVRSGRFRRAMTDLARLAPATLGSESLDVPSYLADELPLPEGRDGRLHEGLSLRTVSFRYPHTRTPALREVSLSIARGQFVAFCGPSGSGKSTLVMLLIGLLKPTSGEVVCDDWNIHEHIRAWQHSIGYVGQSAYLAAGTIRENVAFGQSAEDIDDERVWKALELAAARAFVAALPQSLGTPLSDQGGGLSGGQRQRILIARALYHDPDIVVFDEATAALDNATEREITDAAIRLSRTKTVICVAHRLSTIERSDVIFVLNKGRIVGRGTYASLLARNKVFQKLAQSAPSPLLLTKG